MAASDKENRISMIDYIAKADDYIQTLSYSGSLLSTVVHSSVSSKRRVTETFTYDGSDKLIQVTRVVVVI